MNGNKTVWKFNLTEDTHIKAPVIRFLTVQVQHEAICVWGEVDLTQPNKDFDFVVIGTGWPVPEDFNYLGTVQEFGGIYIWHIYWKEGEAKNE